MSIKARLRKVVGNRRRAQRRRAQRSARLFFTASSLGQESAAGSAPAHLTITGWTRDLSETGLALVVPDTSIEEHHLIEEGRALRVTLELPEGPVVIHATPIRHEKLDQEKGHLICVRVTEVSGGDRARFLEHLRRLRFPVKGHAPRVFMPEPAVPIRFSLKLSYF